MNRIGYLNSLGGPNIGNLFIDIGARISISKVLNCSEYDILQISAFSLAPQFWASKHSHVTKSFWRRLNSCLSTNTVDNMYSHLVHPSNAFNLASISELDYFFIAGCILTVPAFKLCEPLFRTLKKKGIKIIFYGCSGNSYSDFEVNFIRTKLKEIRPFSIITRDSKAFDSYSDLAPNCFDGIDCAFFTNMLPLKRSEFNNLPYVVLTLDKYENKKIEKSLEKELCEYNIIKACHVPYSDMDAIGVPKKEGTLLVSDSPLDYLYLYASAKEVHSDRVHACVPTLAFGNPCRLYAKTPRAKLFNRTCKGDITKELCQPNDIDRLQKEELTFLSEILVRV